MNRILLSALGVVLAATVFAGNEAAKPNGVPLDGAFLKGEINNADPAAYKVGDEITFTIRMEGVGKDLKADDWQMIWERQGDDGANAKGVEPLPLDQPFVYTTKSAKPGTVRFIAQVTDKSGKVYRKNAKAGALTPDGRRPMNGQEKYDVRVFFDGSALVEPGKVEQVPEPADFDEFWAKQKARLAAVPMKVLEYTPVKVSGPNADCFAVKIACAGERPVTGYLSLPKSRKDGKKFPAKLEVDGYGCNWPWPYDGGSGRTEIMFHLNAHGFELGQPRSYYQEFSKQISVDNTSYAFSKKQNSDPETTYFNGMALRVMRALEYLKSLPEWDGKTLKASGGSQGGLQSIWAAGLDKDVNDIVSEITWCCDMNGESMGRLRGGWYIAGTDALRYYDPINHAKRINPAAKVNISRAGLGDYTCPPMGVWMLYNAIPCAKRIHWVQGSSHGYVPPPPYQQFDASDDQTVTVKAGEDWIPLDYRKDIEAGSALDFSKQGLQDAPAGKYGWLKNVNGHFEFERRPGQSQRFYGVNFCFGANYPDHDFADKLVTRIVRLGYNSVRIHHYERELVKGTKDNLGLNPDYIDKLDYFLAKCYAAGLYVTTDLFVSRPVCWRAIGIERDGDVGMQVYKNLVHVNESAFENWCAFAKGLLEHVNPYTGRAYRDEPGIPLISLINEGNLDWCWKDIGREEAMKRAWTTWLAERRNESASKYQTIPDDTAKVNPWWKEKEVFREFNAFLERRTFARQEQFLRQLGVKAMLTNQNCGGGDAPMMSVREDLYGYVDNHFYVDHPEFIEKSWRLPSRCKNKNPVLEETLAPVSCAKTRVKGKPFTITEWNFSGPGMYRGVGGIMTGAVAARDDFDGLWRFAYAHSIWGMQDRQGYPDYFNTATDPLGQAGDRASICLFLRRDLSVGDENAIRVDKVRGSLTLETFRTAGGFAPSGTLTTGPVSFDVGDEPATIWVSSLDEKPIAQSSRLLVTHLTDVQADGNVYADKTKCVLKKWGKYPPVVRKGVAKISLSLESPMKHSVWVLDTTGHRLEKLPSSVKDGKLVFAVNVQGQFGARMLYEIVR